MKWIEDLEKVVNRAIDEDLSLALLIQMPDFEKPEMIINPTINLEKKLEYYKKTYDENLEHKYAKGIRIVGYSMLEGLDIPFNKEVKE